MSSFADCSRRLCVPCPVRSAGTLVLIAAVAFCGCGRKEAETAGDDAPVVATRDGAERSDAAGERESVEPDTDAAVSIEVGADELLAARLPIEETREGWVRLFDGHTLFGWETAADANWRVNNGAIEVDSGEIGLLCTSIPWQDYELRLEIKADAETNSGIFLRTPLKPEDPETDCYEVNVAPADNPFPTGSIVKRKRIEEDLELDPEAWHLYEISMVGDRLTVRINGETVCEYVDPVPLGPGRIGLQHNSGFVAFRDIRVRPLGLAPLITDDLANWTQYPEMDGEFRMTDEGLLRVTGGRGQLESKDSFDDFVLLAEAKTASEALNSGIFFRCIPGEVMNGYECQISNEMIDGNPLAPADSGTGGIFRRQDARIVASEDGEWFTVLLIAEGPRFATWVNGLQVADWTDTRPPDPNPRRGLRLEPGTLMIQAHDPTTDIYFRSIDIVPISQPDANSPPEA